MVDFTVRTKGRIVSGKAAGMKICECQEYVMFIRLCFDFVDEQSSASEQDCDISDKDGP